MFSVALKIGKSPIVLRLIAIVCSFITTILINRYFSNISNGYESSRSHVGCKSGFVRKTSLPRTGEL